MDWSEGYPLALRSEQITNHHQKECRYIGGDSCNQRDQHKIREFKNETSTGQEVQSLKNNDH